MSLSLGLTKGFDIISFMTDLFETTTSIRKLSKKYGVDSKILHNWMNILCSKDFRRKRSSEVKRQENFRRAHKPTYAGPRLYNAYLWSTTPKWWKGTTSKGRTLSHHLVCCKRMGLDKLPTGYAVHHINGNKTDNRGKNLVLMLHKDHAKLHRNRRLCRAIDEESLYVREYSV